MTYKNFSTEDFVQDKRFRQWVLQPDKASHIFWHEFLSENPDKLSDIKQAKAIVLSMQFPDKDLPETDIAQMWENIKRTNLSLQSVTGDYLPTVPLHPIAMAAHKAGKPVRQYKHWLKVAASFAGILLLSTLLAYLYFEETTQFSIYQTHYGETKKVVLPDSSVVILNANTILKVPNHWKEKAPREVWLQGEAFFEIEKQISPAPDQPEERRKFLVHTENLKVEVLGTAFNVSTRSHKTQVVLNTGKVKLIDRHENELVLEPGELAELSKAQQEFVRKVVNPTSYSSWKENKLICDGTTLDEIVEVMQNRFGVEVSLEDSSLAKIEASGTIPLDDIEVFIAVLQKSIGLDIVQQSEQVMIRGKQK